jgi:hypothetical protein
MGSHRVPGRRARSVGRADPGRARAPTNWIAKSAVPRRTDPRPGGRRLVLRMWRRRRESNPCKRFCRPLPEPLGHVATGTVRLAAPRGFEPRLTDPKSAVLPLDDGAPPRLTLAGQPRPIPAGHENGAEDGTRTRDPHLGKVMLYQLSHFRPPFARHDTALLVPRARIELATPGFSVQCSTN